MSSKRKLKRRNPAPVAGFKYERMCQAGYSVVFNVK